MIINISKPKGHCYDNSHIVIRFQAIANEKDFWLKMWRIYNQAKYILRYISLAANGENPKICTPEETGLL